MSKWKCFFTFRSLRNHCEDTWLASSFPHIVSWNIYFQEGMTKMHISIFHLDKILLCAIYLEALPLYFSGISISKDSERATTPFVQRTFASRIHSVATFWPWNCFSHIWNIHLWTTLPTKFEKLNRSWFVDGSNIKISCKRFYCHFSI